MFNSNNKDTFLGGENVHNLIMSGIFSKFFYDIVKRRFKRNQLRVWWGESTTKSNFEYIVRTPDEAFRILKMFKAFEHFQRLMKNETCCNVGGLLVYKKQPTESGAKEPNYSWIEWQSERGKDINFYLEQKTGLRNLKRDLKKQKNK